VSEFADTVYLRDLLAAGYTRDEVRNWGAPEYIDDDGEVYYLSCDIDEWLDAGDAEDRP
jgi:hypothetical protein